MAKNNRKKKKNSYRGTNGIVIAKLNETKKVTIAAPHSKIAYYDIISVSPYRKIAKSELYVDEIIIKNIIERKKTQVLWEKLIKKIRQTNKKNLSNNKIVAKSAL